jgi:hypothetical protein
MARDRKASIKFSARASASLPDLAQTITSDKLSTTVTYSGTSEAYRMFSDVFYTPNMVRADAQDFDTQTEVEVSGSSDLVGINAQNQDLFVKIIVTNNASVANLGSPVLTVFGASAITKSGSQPYAMTSPVAVSAAVSVTTTASASAVYYIPVMTSKPYLQLRLTGTSTGAAAGTVTISLASIVNGRDGSVSL